MPPQRKRAYQSDWEKENDFKDWIEQSPYDSKKAWCKWCKLQIRAHRADLCRHVKSVKHQKCLKSQIGSRSVKKVFKVITNKQKRRRTEVSLALFAAVHMSYNSII